MEIQEKLINIKNLFVYCFCLISLVLYCSKIFSYLLIRNMTYGFKFIKVNQKLFNITKLASYVPNG